MKLPPLFYFLLLVQTICVFLITRFEDYYDRSELKYVIVMGVFSPLFVGSLYVIDVEDVSRRIAAIVKISAIFIVNFLVTGAIGMALR
jgi:hypothetical protein